MKKILLIAFLAIFSFSSLLAQGVSPQDKELSSIQTIMYFDGETVNSSLGVANDSIWFYTIKKNSPNKSLPLVVMQIDTIASGGTIQTILYGKHTFNANWVGLDTVTFYKTVDTTFYLDPSTFGIRDYYKVQCVGSTKTTKGLIDKMDFKIVQE